MKASSGPRTPARTPSQEAETAGADAGAAATAEVSAAGGGGPNECPFEICVRSMCRDGKESKREIYWYKQKPGGRVRLLSSFKDAGDAHHLPHTWVNLYDEVSCKHFFLNWLTGECAAEPPLCPSEAERERLWRNLRTFPDRWAPPRAVGGSPPIDKDLVNLRSKMKSSERLREPGKRIVGATIIRETGGNTHFIAARSRERATSQAIAVGVRTGGEGATSAADGRRGRNKCKEVMSHVFVFPSLKMETVRRRAVLIACTYSKRKPVANFSKEPLLGPLPSTVRDVLTFRNVLVRDRGWQPEDIVVLTDAKDSAEVKEIKRKGSRVETSSIGNVASWLCRLVSGLDAPEASNVCNSLVLHLAGHGDQYSECPKPRASAQHDDSSADAYTRREDDGMDEGFATSSAREVVRRATGPDGRDEVFDKGILLDDDVNEALVGAVFRLPNTQLVIVADMCNGGTMADLPFLLTNSDKWTTSGESRRIEEDVENAIPPMFDCGHGLVYSFAGAEDGGKAIDAYYDESTELERGDDSHAADTRQRRAAARETRGGILTTAFADSCLATGTGSMLDGVQQVRASIAENNEEWKAWMQREEPERWEESRDCFSQVPSFASSHSCRLDRPLYL
jgi:hypothetical protein